MEFKLWENQHCVVVVLQLELHCNHHASLTGQGSQKASTRPSNNRRALLPHPPNLHSASASLSKLVKTPV